MGKFDRIEELRKSILHNNDMGELKERVKKYNKALAEEIQMETYVQYMISGFDIYVDVTMIVVCTMNVYHDCCAERIEQIVNENIREEQMLIY